MLTKDIAEEIVKETMGRLNRNINIIDISGTIIASGDPERINLFHEGGLHVVKTGNHLIITEENKDQWSGSKLGINLPIEFQNEIIGAIGISGKKEEVEEFGDLVKMTTELMIKQCFIATKSEWRQRTKEETFEEMIADKPNFEVVKQRLQLLGISIAPPYHLFLLEIKAITIQNQFLIRKIEEIFNKDQTLVGFTKISKIFILATGISNQTAIGKINLIIKILKQLEAPYKVGYGTPINDKDDISISYREAQIALHLQEKPNSILSKYSDYEAQALVYQLDREITDRYVRRTFATLSTKYIETLQTFFDYNLSITDTSNQLFVHRNTLIYRLRKVKDETGLNPQDFTDAVKLQLAIWIYRNKGLGN